MKAIESLEQGRPVVDHESLFWETKSSLVRSTPSHCLVISQLLVAVLSSSQQSSHWQIYGRASAAPPPSAADLNSAVARFSISGNVSLSLSRR